MKAAAAILLVCIAIQNVCAFNPPLPWRDIFNKVKGRGREIADEVWEHVDKASKTMNEQGERLMEYKKAVNETLKEGKEHLKKLWTENKDGWSRKAEEEWLKFKNRAEEGLEQVKEGVYGIEEVLDTNLPERPRAVMKAMITKLKDLVLAVKEIYKKPKSQGNDEQEELLQAEVAEEEGEEPQPTITEEEIWTVPTTEPEVYPEEFEPTEVMTTPTGEWSTEFPEESVENKEGKDWWVGPEGDGLVTEKEIPDESDEETPQESDDGEYEEDEDEKPIIEEGVIEEEYPEEPEAEEEEKENDEDDANSSEEESHQVSPLDFLRRRNRGKLGGILKKRAKAAFRRLFERRGFSSNGSEKP